MRALNADDSLVPFDVPGFVRNYTKVDGFIVPGFDGPGSVIPGFVASPVCIYIYIYICTLLHTLKSIAGWLHVAVLYLSNEWRSATTAMQRSLSFDNQWEQTINDINQLVHIHVSEQCEVDKYKGNYPCISIFLVT